MDNLNELKNSLQGAVAANNVIKIREIISNPEILSMNQNDFEDFIENIDSVITKGILRELKKVINGGQAAEAREEDTRVSVQRMREELGRMLANTFPNNLRGNEEFNTYLMDQCGDNSERKNDLRGLRTEAFNKMMSGGSYKKHNSRRKSKRGKSKRGKSKRGKSKRGKSKRQKSKRSKRYY